MSDDELHDLEDELEHDLALIARMNSSARDKARRIRAEYERRRGEGTVHELRPRNGGQQ